MKKCNQCFQVYPDRYFENELICERCETLNRLIKEREEKEQVKQAKIEAKLAPKRILAQAKIKTYTAISSQLQPYLTKYGQALKEIWSKPITNRWYDYKILENHELGSINKYFGTHINNYEFFDWHYQLKELNKQVFQLKIG